MLALFYIFIGVAFGVSCLADHQNHELSEA